MQPGNYNLVVKQGDTFIWNFRVETNGVGWNLSDYSAKMQVRESQFATSAMIDATELNYITMTENGHVNVTVPSSVMADIPSGRFLYEFELISSGNEDGTLLEGNFIVEAQVSY